MSGNSDVIHFDRPQPVYRTSTRLRDEKHRHVFDVVLTGTPEMIESFMGQGVPLRIEWVSPELSQKLQQSLRPAYDDAQSDMPSPEEQEKEVPPAYPIRGLDIDIQPGRPWPEGRHLLVRLDPDVGQGESHYFYVNGATEAWATCTISGGDVDLYLCEIVADGTWVIRDSSLRSGTVTDGVDASKQTTGRWRLQVYGFKASTYELSGVFKP